MYIYIYIYIYIYVYTGPHSLRCDHRPRPTANTQGRAVQSHERGARPPRSQTKSGQMVFSQKPHTSPTCCHMLCLSAHMLPHVCHISRTLSHESRLRGIAALLRRPCLSRPRLEAVNAGPGHLRLSCLVGALMFCAQAQSYSPQRRSLALVVRHYGELRHFCDDPACPDPVLKLAKNGRTANVTEIMT